MHPASLNKLLVVCTLVRDRKYLASILAITTSQWHNVLFDPYVFEARPRYFTGGPHKQCVCSVMFEILRNVWEDIEES